MKSSSKIGSPLIFLSFMAVMACKKTPEQSKPQTEHRIIVSTLAGEGKADFQDGPASTAKFNGPLDVAADANGAVFVADAFNGRIRKISNGIVTTFAGKGTRDTVNGTGTDAGYFTPSRLTFDDISNLYTLDALDPRVRKITPEGVVYTFAGTTKAGFLDGPTGIAQFGHGFGIFVDTDGTIYIGDSENRRVRRIIGQVHTIAGNGIPGFKNGSADTAEFFYPAGLTVDSHGNIYVADFNRIRKIDTTGFVSTFVGSDSSGYRDGDASVARFVLLEDMVMDGLGNLYVTDDSRIRKITPQGNVSTIAGSTAGFQDGDASVALFNSPQGLGIDHQGNIYVADFNNNRIRKISFQ